MQYTYPYVAPSGNRSSVGAKKPTPMNIEKRPTVSTRKFGLRHTVTRDCS